MKASINPTEKDFALWLKKQVMLTERMDFIQRHVENCIHDVGELARQVVKINEAIANHMAGKSKAAREDHVRPD